MIMISFVLLVEVFKVLWVVEEIKRLWYKVGEFVLCMFRLWYY